jgi:hypothetical protein
MSDILCIVIKNKDYAKVDEVLKFFIELTSGSREGQVNIVKINGLLTELVDLLKCKYISPKVNVLILLRNLCSLKENKPYFLTDGTFYKI